MDSLFTILHCVPEVSENYLDPFGTWWRMRNTPAAVAVANGAAAEEGLEAYTVNHMTGATLPFIPPQPYLRTELVKNHNGTGEVPLSFVDIRGGIACTLQDRTLDEHWRFAHRQVCSVADPCVTLCVHCPWRRTVGCFSIRWMRASVPTDSRGST